MTRPVDLPSHSTLSEASMEFVSFSPGVEVNANALGAIIAGFQMFPSVALRFLRRHGIVDDAAAKKGTLPQFAPDAWFPLQPCLEVMKGIAREVGAGTLYNVGLQVPNHARLPPQMRDLHDAIRSLDITFHMNHRKGGVVMFDPASGKMLEGIGHYTYTRVRDRAISIVCESPYPCEFDRGLLAAFAARFEPKAKVRHDDGPCRQRGAERCTFSIDW